MKLELSIFIYVQYIWHQDLKHHKNPCWEENVYQWALAKNENIHATSDQCAVSDEVFRAMGKK